MNDFVSQYQLQNLEQQNQANSRPGSGIGTGVEIAAEGIGEAGIFGRRQPASSPARAYPGVAGDMAESSGEIAGAATEAGRAALDCAAEAGGTIVECIVNFICECIAGICDGI